MYIFIVDLHLYTISGLLLYESVHDRGNCKHTAGSTAAVHRGHPEVGRASVENHSEGLRGGTDGDHPKVSQLCGWK